MSEPTEEQKTLAEIKQMIANGDSYTRELVTRYAYELRCELQHPHTGAAYMLAVFLVAAELGAANA